MDILKKYKKIIALIIIILSILCLYSFKRINAESRNGGTVTGIDGDYRTDSTVRIDLSFFKYNNFVYCAAKNSEVVHESEGYRQYNVSGPITINGENSGIENALAYIFSQTDDRSSWDLGTAMRNSDAQRALWYLIHDYDGDGTVSSILGTSRIASC